MKPAMRANNRNDALLDGAAELFAKRGYQASTIREIGKSCGMLPGSVYYHYPNKDALLAAVYEEGVRRLTDRVEAALEGIEDPWLRLEHALATHVAMIIEPTAYASVIIRILPDAAPAVAARLIELRNRYERIIASLVEDLPLAPDADRRLLRLLLIGAANHAPVWRRPDGDAGPEDIARTLLAMARGLAPQTSRGGDP
ncbi:MAG: TetR/AcrR family transcriptional regulator [Pseudomonadota bacterium]